MHIKHALKRVGFLYRIYRTIRTQIGPHLEKRRLYSELRQRISDGTLLDPLSEEDRAHWSERCEMIMRSPLNAHIPRHRRAGRLTSKGLVMHNGIRIHPLSYYDLPMLNILTKNRGVHEPQEEYVFSEVLKHVPEEAVMVELGAYWAFYSLWFKLHVKRSRCFMYEPSENALEQGRVKFKMNRQNGFFGRAYIGAKPGKHRDGTTIQSVDAIFQEQGIKYCHILHSDIQGAELDMLKGAETSIDGQKIGFIFISTHSNALHRQCLSFLEGKGFFTIASSDLDETYSWDGLIVARSAAIPAPGKLDICNRGRVARDIGTNAGPQVV